MHKILAERIGIASLLLLGLFSFAGWYAFFHQSFAAYISGTQSILLGFSLAGTFFFLGALVWIREANSSADRFCRLCRPSFSFASRLLPLPSYPPFC
ncbi:MAG: hypothetical protein WDN67_04320 [Candidatus Moraniibacteriota bacterium]